MQPIPPARSMRDGVTRAPGRRWGATILRASLALGGR